MKPKRIQRRRTKGWRMPKDTVYVGRGTVFGNPFIGEQEWATNMFRKWMDGKVSAGREDNRRRYIIEKLPLLRGKNLACWCPLDKPCHADVLLEVANRDDDRRCEMTDYYKTCGQFAAALEKCGLPIPRTILGKDGKLAIEWVRGDSRLMLAMPSLEFGVVENGQATCGAFTEDMYDD